MKAKFEAVNPWSDAIFGHLLITKLAYDVVLKACAAPLRAADLHLTCNEPRLNPFEFHGRRSPGPMPQQTTKAD